MLMTILVGAFLAVVALGAVIGGLSCLFARAFWWSLYRRLSWPGLTGQGVASMQRPWWWELNAIAGGLVQIVVGLGLGIFLILTLLARLF